MLGCSLGKAMTPCVTLVGYMVATHSVSISPAGKLNEEQNLSENHNLQALNFYG